MKNKLTAILAAALILTLVSCLQPGDGMSGGGGNTPGGGTDPVTVNSIGELETYLKSKSRNTRDNPYTISIAITNDSQVEAIREILLNYWNKYVNLDLSGSTITSFGHEGFNQCNSLTGIIIPDNVTSIGWEAFGQCRSLTNITIPSRVTSIESNAFSRCTSLAAINVDAGNTAYSSQDGVLYNKAKTTLIACPGGKTGSFTIPSSVTNIGEYAFWGCESLTSVTIPNSVISIGNFAFEDCTRLTSVTIGNSVTSIGHSVFSYCTSLASVTIPASVTSIGGGAFNWHTGLTAINVDAGNTEYSSQDGVLYNKNKTILVAYPGGKTGSFTIPSSVTSIGNGAFESCTSLTSVTIPNSVTTIEFRAFGSCESLTSITIPSSVTSIESGAFESCESLTNVIIGNGVTIIEQGAFNWCPSLNSITIPASVTSIGDWTFGYCTRLTSVTFAIGSNIANTNFGSDVFPEGSVGYGGNTLKTAYSTGKAGTYTRAANGSTWTKQ